MLDNIRNDLTAGKHIEACVFCKRKPIFVQWEGRALVILKHHCKIVKYESVCFPSKADEIIFEWNSAIELARSNSLEAQAFSNELQLSGFIELLSTAKLALPLMKQFFIAEQGAGTIKKLEQAISKADKVLKGMQIEAKKTAIEKPGVCTSCGCTDEDCSECIKRTGEPCAWANSEHTLCTACVTAQKR